MTALEIKRLSHMVQTMREHGINALLMADPSFPGIVVVVEGAVADTVYPTSAGWMWGSQFEHKGDTDTMLAYFEEQS